MANYPIPKFRFRVEFKIDGKDIRAGFTEVSGLDNETDVIEYRTGTDASKYKILILGLSKASRVTMKRGIIADDTKMQFYNWWKKTIDLQTTEDAQIDGVLIKLLDEKGEPVITWKLKNALALKLQSTDLKSDGNEVAIESLELAHEGLTLEG